MVTAWLAASWHFANYRRRNAFSIPLMNAWFACLRSSRCDRPTGKLLCAGFETGLREVSLTLKPAHVKERKATFKNSNRSFWKKKGVSNSPRRFENELR